MYSRELASIHHDGFGALAARTAPEVVRLLHAHRIRDGRIVELGCGSGITARYLTGAGFDVVGLDLSPAMIELARTNAPAARFRVAAIETTAFPRCRAVVGVGEVISYIRGGMAALRRMFRRIHDALAPGGLLLFDFMESAARRAYRTKSSSGDGWAMLSAATFDKSTRVLTRRMVLLRHDRRRLTCAGETHRVRVYSRHEIRSALVDAGFSVRLRRCYGSYPLPAGDLVAIATRRI